VTYESIKWASTRRETSDGAGLTALGGVNPRCDERAALSLAIRKEGNGAPEWQFAVPIVERVGGRVVWEGRSMCSTWSISQALAACTRGWE